MRSFTVVIVGVLVAMLITGCGRQETVNPRADCEELVSAYFCPRVVACVAGTAQVDCVAGAKTFIDCESAKGEAAGLDTCRADLSSTTCPAFWDGSAVQLPASCRMVFTR